MSSVEKIKKAEEIWEKGGIYVCPMCDGECQFCDDDYQCSECEKEERELMQKSIKSVCYYHDDYHEMADCAFHEPHKDANTGRRCEFWNTKTGECFSQEKIDFEEGNEHKNHICCMEDSDETYYYS